MSGFKKATRKASKLRLALDGPAGSGKTFTGLRFAFALGARVAVIDTERGSASKYQGENPDGIPFEFDVLELTSFSPSEYTAAIEEASRHGYDALLIDSLSHAWEGTGGALDLVDKKSSEGRGSSFSAWKDVTPLHRKMVDAILNAPLHVIATMRSKVEYVLEEETNRHGRTVQVPRRVGMAPVQRAGMEYEFDIYGSMDQQTHTLTISKSRCRAVADQKVVMPGAAWLAPVVEWLTTGTPTPEPTERVKEFLRLTHSMKAGALRSKLRESYGNEDFAQLTTEQQDEILEKLKEAEAAAGRKQVEDAEKRIAALPRTGSK